MKTTLKYFTFLISAFLMLTTSCKKDKKPTPEVENPTPPANENEVITTLKMYITDSTTNATFIKTFKDPDGEGQLPGSFLNNGADSLFTLQANHTYFCELYFLDETKNPVDTLSKAIAGEESYQHMIFFNGDPSASGDFANTIVSPAPNYAVKLNGSNVKISYMDLDNGPDHGYTQRNVGINTKLRTSAGTGAQHFPFIVTLRHQPGNTAETSSKDGSFNPGSTDLEVMFKLIVN